MTNTFDRFSRAVERAVGTPTAFILACAAILIWAACGPIFGFSDTYQLIVNTGTTIVTFLMIFLVQATQNRDTQALHLKLDELIRVTRDARNSIAAAEDFDRKQLDELHSQFASMAKRDCSPK
jgi:low affinity Fe/Cu permease